MQKNYVIYHLHSDMSSGVTSIDSVTKYWQYIDRAKECGMKAMAFSEHGSVFAWYEKKCAMEKAGIKYIHAEEFYVTEKIDREPNGDPVKIRDNWHCVLIAKNYEGVKEINRLASKSFNRKDGHYYYVPRIELSDLFNTSDNIIITSACVAGIYGKASDEIQKRFIDFMVEHKDRCYLEIQHHNVEKQIVYNQKMLELSQKYGLNLIAGTDTHCLNETHAKGRVMLQRSKHIFFEDEVGWDLTFKTYDELIKAYQAQGSLPEEVYLQAIENTNIMADEIEEFEVDRCIKYPHIYSDPERVFKEKVNRACKEHAYALKNHSVQEIAKRVSEEFDVYKKVGAIDFMLLETYLREWEQTQGIQRGYSRGSVSGSFIAYLLGITEMDSLKFDLNFFRFLNPSRVTNSDIDTDFCEQDRAKVKEFLLRDKMNLKTIHTSEIITFNTIATKGAIKDMCRAMEIPLDKAQELSDMVDTDGIIPDKVRKEYPELCSYVDIVSGTIVSIGSHPSGVLVSDLDIEADVGLCSLSTSEYPVSMLDMHSLDTLMYVKLDVLGLDNIGVINETCKLVGIDRLTPDNVDLNDEEVWKDIRDDTTLIFQWESDSAQAYLKKFMSDETRAKAKEINPDFSSIKWFSFGNGLIRPGCASFRDDVAEGNINTTGFKEFDDFLAITLGRITMQEDIMRFCKRFCGYTDSESDTVRRKIAKKGGTADLLDEMHDRFVKYSHDQYHVDEALLEEIFPPIKQGILDASQYAFSWNHSDAYSCIGYISGYLRHYYPLEFLTASLNVFADKFEKTTEIVNYMKKRGVALKPIKFRESKAYYYLDKANKEIYKGMLSVKFMNRAVADKLYEMRNDHFDSFVDLLKVFPGNSKQRDILISLDFFNEFGKAQKLKDICAVYDKYEGKKILKKDGDIDIEEARSFASGETEKQLQFTPYDINRYMNHLIDKIPDRDISIAEHVNAQREFLGHCDIMLPEERGKACVLDVDVKYSPRIDIYKLDTGEQVSVKVAKKAFANIPLKEGDIITYRTEDRPAVRKTEDGFEEIPGKFTTWLAWYGVSRIENNT